MYNIKICVIGFTEVGKSSLLRRLKNDEFSESIQSTLGCEYFNMEFQYNGTPVDVQLWDSCGQKKYMPIIPQVFKGMHGVMLVYDISNQKSYDMLEEYIKIMYASGNENCVAILIGNKCDKIDRVISTEKAKQYSEQHNFAFMETSAKTAYNVKSAFSILVNVICKSIVSEPKIDKEIKQNTLGKAIKLEDNTKKPEPAKKGCC